MRKVQLSCAPNTIKLYQVAECSENDGESVKTAPSTGDKNNEGCYPSYLLFILIVYSTVITSSCCWLFACGLKRKRKKKKKKEGEEKLNYGKYDQEYISVKAEEM